MTENEYKTILNFASTIECLKTALKESHEENRRLINSLDDIYSVTIGTDESNWKDNMEHIKDVVAPYAAF